MFSGIVLRNLDGHGLPFYNFSFVQGGNGKSDDQCTYDVRSSILSAAVRE